MGNRNDIGAVALHLDESANKGMLEFHYRNDMKGR
jgi:hypothetical protein